MIYNLAMKSDAPAENPADTPVETPSEKQQRLYAGLNQSLLASTFGGSAAEAHGLASGLCCRGVSSEQLVKLASEFNLNDQASLLGVQSLMEMSYRNLSQTNFDFDLWLPQDLGLIEESTALSQWCSGFIIAFLHDGQSIIEKLGETADEALNDLMAIAELEHTRDNDQDDQLNENEVAFFEITQYVRMSVQLLFEEIGPTAVAAQTSE